MGDMENPTELREDQWATVDLPWSQNPLLFTVGTSWLTAELTSACPARCAVLHRVVLPTQRVRHSLPFLADLVSRSTHLACSGELTGQRAEESMSEQRM